MNHIEAMKQALEALEQWNTPLYKRGIVIQSLRQAIAEAEQVSYSGNGTAGRENMTAPTGFFFQMPKAEKQEPVAWQVWVGADTPFNEPMGWSFYNTYDSLRSAEASARTINAAQQAPFAKIVPLYTHPQPKREWVGLTDEEHTKIAVDAGCMSADWVFYGAAVERALKKKNT